jgi:WD40 repeat protein
MPVCSLSEGQAFKGAGLPRLRTPRARGWILHSLILEGHTHDVNSVAFSPDGQSIVSGADDSTVRVWDATTGIERHIMHGHESYVNSVAFSHDSQSIVSGSSDKTVRVWDATTGTERHHDVMSGHERSVRCVAFSPDGQSIVSGSDDETVRVWDATTGTERHVMHGHIRKVTSFTFSPDGLSIIARSYNTVCVWDATTGMEQHTTPDLDPSPAPAPRTIAAFHVNETTGWLSRIFSSGTRQRLCWLPKQYRGRQIAFHGQTVCIGAPNGAITILDFLDVPFSYE